MIAQRRRKLIDLNPLVFDQLSFEARRQNVSLKRLIENILEEAARPAKGEFGPAIMRMVGSAKPTSGVLEDIDDDRLRYLLSK
ncbi:MAG: hypothetical protein J6Y32_02535 [Bacteroidales bacterium]|nr:hypothetical protein [Bacteroidales bacterium]